ncbi:Hypothetical protein LUCI_5128 [Lucifera butyrica]|uniref:Uncharacterized protein n=1 Tax=Lucifera butyrica TaxID=1351585 RepID=A0A498RG94_9FIRM|nr:ROK family protein [Lucifera butyrica]VBB09830.1 Hypothetical protein LUCI_5128 [Lucifera butyrica]
MFQELKRPVTTAVRNCRTLYAYIREHEPVSKAKLREITDFKLSTLTRAMDRLIAAELIYAADIGESSGGRKPLLFRINPAAGYIVGVDISRTYTRVALMDLKLTILKSGTFGMFTENTPEETLNKIGRMIDEFTIGIDRKRLLGVGVGAVGPVDRERGIILNPVNFPAAGWENVSIKKILEEKTGLVTLVENGANAAVLGEYRQGCGRGLDNMAYIIAGVGVRLGVIANNKLVNANEGSFGHTVIDREGRKCSCGGQGCVEAYISLKSVLTCFIDAIKQGRYSPLVERVDYDLTAITLDAVCTAAEEGDPLALEVLAEAAGHFAVAVANLANILNPRLIILGGLLVKKSRAFYETTVKLARERFCRINGIQLEFSRGTLGDDVIVTGAGSIVLDSYLH